MGTFKRTPFEIDTTVRNGSKYLNQMQFTGIVQNNNTFDVDQNSLTDALNVYVNEQNTLVSREPLIKDNIEIDYPSETAQLIDIKECNGVKVFVFKDDEEYIIIAYRNKDDSAEIISNKYYLCVHNQYILCFRTEGAVLINTSLDKLSWEDLTAHTDIPVTKITTGNVVQDFDENQLSDKHKEKFIRKNDLNTVLPIDNTAAISGKIYNKTSITTLDNLDRPWLNTNLNQIRILNTPVEIGSNYCITLAFNKTLNSYIICMADTTKVHISYDNGNSFDTIFFPTTANKHRGSVSDDGRYYFYIATNGVYRLDLGTYAWTLISVLNNSSNTIDKSCEAVHFVNGENFCFYTRLQGSDWAIDTSETRKIRVYYKGINLQNSSTNTGYLCYSDVNVNVFATLGSSGGAINAIRDYNSIKMCVDETYGARLVLNLAGQNNGLDDYGNLSGWNTSQVIAIFGKANTAATIVSKSYSAEEDFHINKVTPLTNKSSTSMSGIKAFGTKMILDGNSWLESGAEKLVHTFQYFEFEIYSDGTLNSSVNNTISTYTWPNEMNDDNRNWFPYYITTKTFLFERGFKLYTYNTNNSKYETQTLPNLNGNNMQKFRSAYESDFKYAILDGKFIGYTINNSDPSKTIIFTNILSDDETVEFVYTYNTSVVYPKVPSLAYSSSELYLVFDNTLMITKNTKDGEKILFNLPKINNQSFANNIEALINISTTELAIFFENGITICTQVSDDLTGYRYDYAKTRLTLGTSFGSSVINTADGASTLYATPRGLAIMNYQAYMATTDQTLQFVSDKIYAIWNKFYLSSENITLVQHGDYVFVYNTSNQYLMLDLRNYSWWKFEIPFNIKKLLTDQIDLKLISDKLYKFKRINNDTDKIEDDYVDNQYYDVDNEPIRWMFMSQRIHFNLPNHYKNMKQLVFHMIQSTGHISTFNAQVKLYRNTVNYKDMEVIPFDFNFAVDEFRTFVKRFNYWKINLLQYGVANDDKAAVPARLVCNGIDIKYEIGDEVR
jgi:hypothetical protein